MLKFKAERFVEANGGEVIFPDVQINSFDMQFCMSKGNNMQHKLAGQATFTILGVYDDALDIANSLDGICRWQHQFGFSSSHTLYLNQKNHCFFMGGWINRAKILLHFTMNIARGRITIAIQYIDQRDIVRLCQAYNQRRRWWFINHNFIPAELRLFFAGEHQNRNERIARTGQE